MRHILFILVFIISVFAVSCGGDDVTAADNANGNDDDDDIVLVEVDYAECTGDFSGDDTGDFTLVIDNLDFEYDIDSDTAGDSSYEGTLGFDDDVYGFIYNDSIYLTFEISEEDDDYYIDGEWHDTENNEHGTISGECSDVDLDD